MEPLRVINEVQPQTMLRIYCFGTFRVIRPGENLALGIVSKHKMWLLLKYLIINKRSLVSTHDVIEHLWPDQKNRNDTAALRTTLSRLKSLIEPAAGLTKGSVKHSLVKYKKDTCALDLNYPFWLDVDAFEKLCSLAHRQGCYNRQEAIATYIEALELYQGDFLAEDSDFYWTATLREYYRRLFLDSILELTKWLTEGGDFTQARRYLEYAVRLDPYAEELVCMLIKVLYESGHLQEAKDIYSYYSALLYTDLGVRPSAELKKLYELIKSKELNFNYAGLILDGNLNRLDHGHGPFVCDPDCFMNLLLVEQRRANRGGEACLIVIEEREPISRKIAKNENLMTGLEEIVHRILRKSDIVSSLDGTHLALLLPATDKQGGKIVISNLIKRYREEYRAPNQLLPFKFLQIASF